MWAVSIPDGSAEVLGRLQTRHQDTCLPSTRSPFSPFVSQLLSIHTLTNFVSVSPLDATLTKTSRKSIKTRDFKSFRIRSYTTPSRNPLIKKNLHIHGGRGEGVLCLIILLYLLCLLQHAKVQCSLNREGGLAMVTAERKPTPPEFANEPFVDFSKPENRKAMEDALRKVGAELGREYPLYIAGQKVTTAEKRPSLNPSHPSQVVGVFQVATVEMGIQAIEAAHKAFESWRHVPAGERAECLFRAAAILRRRKFEIEALISNEVGKTWPEAD